MNNANWLGIGSEQDIINIKNNLTGSNGTYDQLITALSGFQSKFVQPLSTMWACKDAMDFGMILNNSITKLLTDINNTFVSFFGVIDKAGYAWATSLQTSYRAINFVPRTFKLDVSLFKENIAGIRGIDKDQAIAVINNLGVIKTEVLDALSKSKTVIINNQKFFGASTSYLIESMANIENRINSALEEIIVAIRTAVNATIAQYQNTEGRIRQTFASQI